MVRLEKGVVSLKAAEGSMLVGEATCCDRKQGSLSSIMGDGSSSFMIAEDKLLGFLYPSEVHILQ